MIHGNRGVSSQLYFFKVLLLFLIKFSGGLCWQPWWYFVRIHYRLALTFRKHRWCWKVDGLELPLFHLKDAVNVLNRFIRHYFLLFKKSRLLWAFFTLCLIFLRATFRAEALICSTFVLCRFLFFFDLFQIKIDLLNHVYGVFFLNVKSIGPLSPSLLRLRIWNC